MLKNLKMNKLQKCYVMSNYRLFSHNFAHFVKLYIIFVKRTVET